MPDRDDLLEAFLAETGWAAAERAPLAGDASQRRYLRLSTGPGGQGCVLMDDPTGSTSAFVQIARHLRAAGLSAPAIIAAAEGNGFLLMEDLGDCVFARVIETDPGCEARLYDAALDVLVRLHDVPLTGGLVPFTPELMARQASLVFSSYIDRPEQKASFAAELETVLRRNLSDPVTLILRDFHAENLIWLPERPGLQKVGLLDFQDAMAGPVGYDLVSLIHDARRDVPRDLADRLVARFTAEAGLEPEQFAATRAVLCAQRNLRILGVFARLSRQHGKTGYIDLMPRVWAHLMQAVQHRVMRPLAPFADELPPPTPDHLQRLRTPCAATCP